MIAVTSAPRPHSDDLEHRMKRYLLSMAIRTVCVVLVVVVESPWRWLFAVGAVFLPYLAVVMANAGGTRREAPVARPTFERPALPSEAVPDEAAVNTTIIRDTDAETRSGQ